MQAISFSSLRTITQDLAGDTTAAALTQLDRYINQGIRDIRARFEGVFVMEDRYTFTTVVGTQYYDLPIDFFKMKYMTIEIGDVLYTIREIESYDLWTRLNGSVTATGTAAYYFIRYVAGWPEVGLYPVPSAVSDTNGAIVDYIVDPADLEVADITITVASFTNGSATVTDTEFTAPMAGRWIKPDVATGGDGNWYQIDTVSAGVSATLTRTYEGVTGASVTVTVAQIPLLPPDTHILAAYFAAAHYFMQKRDSEMFDRYWQLYLRGVDEKKRLWGKKSVSAIGFHGKGGYRLIDPNRPPKLVT